MVKNRYLWRVFANEMTISISGSLSMVFIEVLHKNAEEINGM